MNNFNTTLVVMAAGMGSRFGGLKQLAPIGPNGEVLLDYSVHDAKKAGFNKVVFVIKHAIEKDFREVVGKRIEKKIDVDYAFQELDKLPSGFVVPAEREKPWGTGHAVLCCKEFVTQPFAAINADDFYGPSAYKQINSCLAKQDGKYCMVGFRLKNTLTDNGTGLCAVNKYSDSGCVALDFNLRNAASLEFVQNVLSDVVVGYESIAELFIFLEPSGIPVLYNSDTKTVRINFLTHSALTSF